MSEVAGCFLAAMRAIFIELPLGWKDAEISAGVMAASVPSAGVVLQIVRHPFCRFSSEIEEFTSVHAGACMWHPCSILIDRKRGVPKWHACHPRVPK